ncbi:AbrB/MazE/SpoVT family DNA-binding domain-containing protein [Roseateles sp. UC29_93]|uniref:AbrB/MazE/SpoVT family DNA-binding domain-containing protein n=1 Tax=Roseateles sp. UC29_93 TaxID=3350177 RepID=UPI003670ED9B
MEVVLKKMGNSTALILPPTVLRNLGLTAGHALTLETTSDRRIVLTPKTQVHAGRDDCPVRSLRSATGGHGGLGSHEAGRR